MNIPNNTLQKNYQSAILFTLLLAVLVAVLIIVEGKINSFTLINGFRSDFLDSFFKYYTYAGDGVIWVPLLFFIYFTKKEYLIPVIIAIIISTLIAQLMKRVIFPDELRPFSLTAQNIQVYFVEAVKINQFHSFPSGHTTQAFTMALLLAHMINKKSWSIILPLLALIAGYSRVYLAQHFVVDVLAGMIIALLTVHLSFKLSILLSKKKEQNQPEN
jgi:membrane-associated phospholipid phosphatase